MTYRIGVIGGGNMGAAIIRGGLHAGVMSPAEIIIAEIDSARRAALVNLKCDVTDDPLRAAQAETILLAVKPQSFPELARSFGAVIDSRVVISIMAGLSSRVIRESLGGKAHIIRAMPNMACQIGAGMTAIARGEGAQSGDEALANQLFGAIGKTVLVDESLMYAVTAVSGSGPAYVFLLAEAMERAAVSMGFDASTARLLVQQTAMGAGRLLCESSQNAEDLRKAVTSPGGTTAAALDVFTQCDFTNIVVHALTAARDRGIQLDKS